MTTIMKRFTKGVVLKGETADVTENAEGSLFQNSSELRLKAYIEGAVRQVVTNTQSQVLTNKTIDADNNSVSNIQTSNLKAGVLNTSTTLAGAVDTQVPSALAVKTYVDAKAAAQNEASEISFLPAGTIAATNVQAMGQELDGDIQAHIGNTTGAHAGSAISNTPSGNLVATTVQAALNELQGDVDTRATSTDLTNHTSASANVHGIGTGNSVVGTGTSQALTNKTIDADLNTISNIENADIKIGAAIDAAKIADGSVSNAEFQTLDGVTSAIQTQLNAKEPTITTLPITKGGTNSSTALSSNRVMQSSGGAIIEAAAITAARALISDANGIPTHSTVTSTTLGFLDATSSVQTQLNSKVDASGGTLTNGSIVTPVRSDVKQDTKANLTTYALTASNGQIVFATDTKEYLSVKDGLLSAIGSGGGGVSDVDALTIQNFDTSAVSDFTQTGLELVTSTSLDGTQSARLVHQAGSTRSFKQTVAVPPKFRGVNMTASLTIRSSASQGNVTIVFRDETNSIVYPSQQLQTNSQAIASLVTNSTTLVSGFSNSNINSLKVGMTVSGSGIPTGTTIASINTTALTITLSQAATASATVSLRFSDLPRTLQLGFTIPANCSSYSYTISALQESGSPETYIDDVVLKNYWLGMSNQGQSTVSLQTANVTSWQQYTPTFTGFGTPSAVEFEWRQVGENVEIRGKFVTGTPTAVEARISLPAGLTSAGTGIIPSITRTGDLRRALATAANAFDVLIEPSVSYVTFGQFSNLSNPLTKVTGSGAFNTTETQILTASVPCAGLTATSTQSIVTTDLVPAKAVFGNTSLDIPNVTAWNGYTPTFQGFGTPSAVEFEWRQVGEDVEIRGKFVSGTSTAVEARVGLPAGLTSAGTGLIPSLQMVGTHINATSSVNAHGGAVLIEPSVGYITFGDNDTFGSSTHTPLAKATGIAVLDTGATLSFFAKVPCAGLSATSTKTIALTQSGIVQSADSMIRLDGSNGYGSTNTKIRRFTSIIQNIGSDILYQDSATLGGSFTVQTSGIYSISYYENFVGSTGDLGISKNSTQLTTNIQSINITDRLTDSSSSASTFSQSVAWSGYLVAGDILRAHTSGATGSSLTGFTITRQGSLSQVSVNSNSKITIPTSELRFEGASTRGSTATAIVRFDTMAKLRGDAFQVESDAVLGTRITMLKAGRLSIGSTLYNTAAGVDVVLTRNKSTLTSAVSTPASENLSYAFSNAGQLAATVSWTGDVAVGDVFRVAAAANPASGTMNNLNLAFQEQDIAVSVTNTLPQFSESDSSVRVDTANGYGSTATKIRRFSNVRDNIGTDIVYTDDAVNGASFRVLTSGVYNMSYSENGTVAVDFGFSKNASSLTTNFTTLAVAERLALSSSATTGYAETCSWQGYLTAGDVIRPHSQGAAANTNAYVNFTISKVGKPNVTGVNVTPFINVPQPTTQSSFFSQSASVGIATVTGALSSSVGSDIYTYNSTTGVYTTLKTANITMNFLARSASAVKIEPVIVVNGVDTVYSSSDTAAGNSFANCSYSQVLSAGATFSFKNTVGTTDVQRISVTATAQSDTILTAPSTFSTDTAALQYSSTYTLATLSDAPVGTYITYTYAINTNTRTQTSTRPTQTDADMNANGIRLYARTSWASGTSAATPSMVAIQVGKGLKGFSSTLYKLSGKTTTGSMDYSVVPNDGSIYGVGLKEYNESTGIAIFDAGSGYGSAITNGVTFIFSDSTSQKDGYLVINASRSPALTGVPLLQPKIATITDQKASGTAGGTSSATYAARNINTLVDNSGMILNAGSFTGVGGTNTQFQLSAGEYYIEADGTFIGALGAVNTYSKIRLFNATTSASVLTGLSTSSHNGAIAGIGFGGTSRVAGAVVITQNTTFEIQQSVTTARTTDGLGRAATLGDNEIYLVVKITKVK